MSFLMNTHRLTKHRQHNDFINTSLSAKGRFAVLWTGVLCVVTCSRFLPAPALKTSVSLAVCLVLRKRRSHFSPITKPFATECRQCLFAVQIMFKRNGPTGHKWDFQSEGWDHEAWSHLSSPYFYAFPSGMEQSVKLPRKRPCSRTRRWWRELPLSNAISPHWKKREKKNKKNRNAKIKLYADNEAVASFTWDFSQALLSKACCC